MTDLRVDRSRGQHFDWMLAGIVLILAAMGLVNLVSAAASGVEGGSDIVGRQMLVLGLGAFVVVVVLVIDYRHYDRFAYVIYAGSIALLLLTLAIAEEVHCDAAPLLDGRVVAQAASELP